MISYYTVIQYVPDPVTDERVNVGIIVLSKGFVKCTFLRDWRRVSAFGREDIGFLRDFAKELTEACGSQLTLPEPVGSSRLTEDTIKRMVKGWINSIQFSEPKASTRAPHQLLLDAAARFLKTGDTHKKYFRDRKDAVVLATHRLKQALRESLHDAAKGLVKQEYPLQGELDEHRFDIAVANGRVLLAAQALSFEIPKARQIEKDVDATAWKLHDVRRSNPKLPLAVVTLPPKIELDLYDRAKNVLSQLDATVVPEGDLRPWAESVAAKLRSGGG